MDRIDFMSFFRNDEKLNELTPSDRVEIFKTILIGSSDITKSMLNQILSDYGVENLLVVEIPEKVTNCEKAQKIGILNPLLECWTEKEINAMDNDEILGQWLEDEGMIEHIPIIRSIVNTFYEKYTAK